MSRYRDDRDYERGYDGGGARAGRGGYGREDRSDYMDYGGARGSGRDRDFDDEPYGGRSRSSLGGGRDYAPRDDYDDARTGRAYGETGRNWRSSSGYADDRDDYGRSRYEEGRERLSRYFRGEGRGATRSHVRCRDIMTRDVTVATRDATLEQVAAMMRDEDTGVIPVVDREDAPALAGDSSEDSRVNINKRIRSNGRLVGLITDRDIVIRAIAEGKDARTTRAEEIMTTDIHTAQPNDRVIDAIRKMGDKQVRRIPVVDSGGNLRGIISMADVALETEEDRELADALEEISSGSSFWSKIFG